MTGGAQTQDWSGFDDPKVDALFSQAAAGPRPRRAPSSIYQQIDQALWTAMPTLPLFAEPTMLVWSSSLSGVGDDPGGLGPLWNVPPLGAGGLPPRRAHSTQRRQPPPGPWDAHARVLDAPHTGACSSEWRNRQER